MVDDANFQFGINAKVIKDSISPTGDRLLTVEATFNRFILAEVNTHRSHSRNSASSRAIPFRKQVDRVSLHPALPVEWRYEQRGMSGGELLSPEDEAEAIKWWLQARDDAIYNAEGLAEIGVHKSIVNRILEPFMWHTAILSATQDGWDNLFHQRSHHAAQPEFHALSLEIERVAGESVPQQMDYGYWHMPYIDSEDEAEVLRMVNREQDTWCTDEGRYRRVTELLKQVSAARCARVSYLTHDGRRAIEADLELYARLVERGDANNDPVHWSPLEHVATPAEPFDVHVAQFAQPIFAGTPKGNFTGWHQFRHRRH